MRRKIIITLCILTTVLLTTEAQSKKPLSVYKFDFGSGKAAKGYHTFPGQDKPLADNTHFSPYGAYEIARCIVKGIRENIPELAIHLKKNIKPFNPASPDPLSEWKWPLSKRVAAVKPDGN